MSIRYGTVSNNVKHAMLSLGEFTTDQLSELTDEKITSIKTVVARMIKAGFLSNDKELQLNARGRARKIYTLTPYGEEQLNKEIMSSSIKGQNPKARLLVCDIWGDKAASRLDQNSSYSTYDRLNRYFQSDPCLYVVGDTNNIDLLNIRKFRRKLFQKAETINELNMLRLLAEDHLKRAAMDIGINRTKSFQNSFEEIVFGYLLSEMGKTMLSYGTTYISLAHSGKDCFRIDATNIEQWEKAYKAISEAIEISSKYSLYLDLKDVKEYHTIFKKTFLNIYENFFKRHKGLSFEKLFNTSLLDEKIKEYEKESFSQELLVFENIASRLREVSDQEFERYAIFDNDGSFRQDINIITPLGRVRA